MQVDPRTSAALWAPDDSSPMALLPHGHPTLATQCQEPITTHLREPQAPGFLFCWCPEASLPTEHGIPALPTVPDSKRALTPPSKSEGARFPTEGRKAVTTYSAGSTRRGPLPQGTQKPSASHCTSLQESPVSPVQELEPQLLH
jgi:hypothetical protein